MSIPNMMGILIKKEEKWPCKNKTENNASTMNNKPNNNNRKNNNEALKDKAEAIILSVGKTVFITA